MKLVYVLHQDGHPLMPCNPAKARLLLKEGKAKVVKREPFTIKLLIPTPSYVQPVVLGIDKGSKSTGISCISNNKVLFSAEIKHRTDIVDKMESRKQLRRARRNRKWYRPARFNNRSSSRRSGRIPPSVKANADGVLRVIKKISLPISEVVVEDVLIDIAALNNPELKGKLYQQSNRLHENLRLASLLRDKFTCKQCNKKNAGKLEIHHITPRADGGKDTITNLITLCHTCHKKVHAGKITLTGGVANKFDVAAQRTMQGKAYLYQNIVGYFGDLKLVFGYQTSELRKTLGLPKEHDVDAMCVAMLRSNVTGTWDRNNYYEVRFRPRQNRQQFYAQARKGKGRVRYQVNSEINGFHKGDIVLVKGKHVKQIFAINSNGRVEFRRIPGEPHSALPRHMRLLEKQKTIIWAKAA